MGVRGWHKRGAAGGGKLLLVQVGGPRSHRSVVWDSRAWRWVVIRPQWHAGIRDGIDSIDCQIIHWKGKRTIFWNRRRELWRDEELSWLCDSASAKQKIRIRKEDYPEEAEHRNWNYSELGHDPFLPCWMGKKSSCVPYIELLFKPAWYFWGIQQSSTRGNMTPGQQIARKQWE